MPRSWGLPDGVRSPGFGCAPDALPSPFMDMHGGPGRLLTPASCLSGDLVLACHLLEDVNTPFSRVKPQSLIHKMELIINQYMLLPFGFSDLPPVERPRRTH